MRIFLVCGDPGIPLGGTKGASIHLRSLAGALLDGGHDLTLFTAAGADQREAARLPFPVRDLRSGESIIQEARSSRVPDLVYERYALGHEGGLRSARALGVPFALEVNAPLVMEASRHRPDSLRPEHAEAERRLFRESDLVFAVSRPLRGYVKDLRETAEGIVVLRNGFDPGHFPISAALGGQVLAFLGHPKPWHGADRLPGLVADLRARGTDARLLLIGGGRGAGPIVAEAQRLGVAEAIEVTGPVHPAVAARRLLEASVALAPYPPDPFFYFCPLKVIEYMATGLPVVAPAQGDIPEIVGDTGVLVPPGDDRAFLGAVERLLEDRALRGRLGARARLRAFNGFTWEAVADRLAHALTGTVREAVA